MENPRENRNRKEYHVLKDEGRKILLRVHDFFLNEKETGQSLSLNCVQERTRKAMGISESTLRRVLKQRKDTGTVKKAPVVRRRRLTDDLEPTIKESVRDVIYAMYKAKEHVTLKALNRALQEKQIVTMSDSTLWRLVRHMGFRYKTTNNRRVLCEMTHVVAQRHKFLRKYIANLNSEDRKPFVFLDETWIFNKGGNKRSWQDNSVRCFQQPTKTGNGKRYIVIHAGGTMGFVDDASEVFNSTSKSADYHDSMNAEFFEHWFENKVLRALTEPSIIVMDNAPYHSRRCDDYPTTQWRKAQLVDWLERKGIPFDPHTLRANLLLLAKANCPQEQMYYIDQLALKHGHEILRLPAYHCHYNPIELVWGVAKTYFDSHIGATKGTEEDVLSVWKTAISLIPNEEWPKYVEHTEKLMKQSYEQEQVIDDVRPLIFTVNTEEDDQESDYGSDVEDEERER